LGCDAVIVVDTHVLVWAMEGDSRLGPRARDAIEAAARESRVAVSAITPWEIAMLAQKGRLALSREVGAWIDVALAQPGIWLAPIEPSIAVDSARLPGSLHPDPADRLIIATARHAGVPLVTADRAILAYGAQGHVAVIDAAA
jgi:PIN domain nuclease of toxin-antitoxin system